MAIDDAGYQDSQGRMQALRDAGYAVAARYDQRAGRLIVTLSTDVQLAVPVRKLEGLAQAAADDLSEIEISPAGLGLHWPRLDVDVYVPALLQGVFGSRTWIAAQLGAAGGSVRSPAKAAAARENGRKGGRPRKTAAGSSA